MLVYVMRMSGPPRLTSIGHIRHPYSPFDGFRSNPNLTQNCSTLKHRRERARWRRTVRACTPDTLGARITCWNGRIPTLQLLVRLPDGPMFDFIYERYMKIGVQQKSCNVAPRPYQRVICAPSVSGVKSAARGATERAHGDAPRSHGTRTQPHMHADHH